MQLDRRTAIHGGLEEYHQMKLDGINEEEMETNWAKAEEEYYQELEGRATAVFYKLENHFPICDRCYISDCKLNDTTFGCGYIGKKVDRDFSQQGIGYKVIDIPKGVWDEVFVPLTDEQINGISIIG